MQGTKAIRKTVQLTVEEITPTREEVLENQGMAGRSNLPVRILSLLESAYELFAQLAQPRGVMQELPIPEFESIYEGEGMNSPECPFPAIVRQADGLALFAATMGDRLIAKSSELFTKGQAALGYMLDAVNSSAAEQLGRRMGCYFLNLMPEEIRRSRELKVQYYSPGHCGWHISGQKKLFEALRPEEIGVTLKNKWIMHPFKSISGILVVGELRIHIFKPVFSFCKDCREHKCLQRMKLLEKEDC